MSSYRVIAPEGDRRCATCGKVSETRPYGPGYSEICHPCALKDITGTEKRMIDVLIDGKVKPARSPEMNQN